MQAFSFWTQEIGWLRGSISLSLLVSEAGGESEWLRLLCRSLERDFDRAETFWPWFNSLLWSVDSARLISGQELLGATTDQYYDQPRDLTTAEAGWTSTSPNGRSATSNSVISAAAVSTDTKAPRVSSFSPADGATGVNPAANIIINFNEPIKAGSGSIDIRLNSASGGSIESFDAATSSRITINGSQLSIDPASNLQISSTYYVILPSGSVKDLSGNPYAGTSTYDFATGGVFTPTSNPLYAQQWHLKNTGQGGGIVGIDAKLEGAWTLNKGYGGTLGRNVTIAIVDDGLQRTHPDLQGNYLAAASYDYNSGDSDPSPSPSNSHGTACAGVAAAVGYNTVGVTGAAPRAKLAGIRVIAGPSTDAMEAIALNHALDINSIYSNSWGPSDSGTLLAAIGPKAKSALLNGVTNGRGGKGAIYTWAGGNGYQNGDNSNYDGYANSPYVIAVGAVDNLGKRSYYSESGANLLVCSPSSGGTLGIVTTDLVGSVGYNGLSDTSYTNAFGGTSSATPLVSGVIALMLEANPALSWRDVMHVLVNSAFKIDPFSSGWLTNRAGHDFHHDYGFGLIDAQAAVSLAKLWTNVSPLAAPTSAAATVSMPIPDFDQSQGVRPITSSLTIFDNRKIESVEILVNATHTYRGDLDIRLTSPSGTTSVLATLHNDSNDNYSNWTFSSRVHWDELSQGTWKLTVADQASRDTGTLLNWGLTINGTDVSGSSSAAPVQLDSVVSSATQATRLSFDSLDPSGQQFAPWKSTSAPSASTLSQRQVSMPSIFLSEELRNRAPSLDAYLAFLRDWIATDEDPLDAVTWTMAARSTALVKLDAVTGLDASYQLAPKGLAVGLRDTPFDGIGEYTISFDSFTMNSRSLIHEIALAMGDDLAYLYPDLAIQRGLRDLTAIEGAQGLIGPAIEL